MTQFAALANAYREFAGANRILAKQGVVDGFGHVSMRHPEGSARFLLSRRMAIVTERDILSFDLQGAVQEPNAPAVYAVHSRRALPAAARCFRGGA